MTYDFNLDNDLDIKPIVKSGDHFGKWVVNYPFYANIIKKEWFCMEQHREDIKREKILCSIGFRLLKLI